MMRLGEQDMDGDVRTRARIEEHWTASESGDSDTEHAIYAADGILDYPQSGARFRGRSKIEGQRGGPPAQRPLPGGGLAAGPSRADPGRRTINPGRPQARMDNGRARSGGNAHPGRVVAS